MVSKEVMVHTKSQLEDATVEARVLSSVNHFNIIRFISLQRSGPKLMIVMEYVLLHSCRHVAHCFPLLCTRRVLVESHSHCGCA